MASTAIVTKKKNVFLIPAVAGIGLILLAGTIVLGGAAFRSDTKKVPKTESSAPAAPSAKVATKGTVRVQQPSGSLCPPFSMNGATCDIEPEEGSGWIRVDSTAVAGTSRFCWENGEFREIWYLAGGKKHVFDPSKPSPSGVSAYRFFPNEKMTLVYNLAPTCRQSA